MEEPIKCHICGVTEKQADDDGVITVSIHGSCVSCHRMFCKEHTSEFDNTLCSECVSFSNINITKKRIVDNEGVTHKGSQLILTGEAWMRSRELISKMTDLELDSKLEVLKKAVHEAEMILDYRRIIHSQVENEKSGRLSKKLGRLRLISAVDQAHKVSNGTKTAHQAAHNNVKDALGALGKLGLNKDAIANVLLKLAQQKKEVK